MRTIAAASILVCAAALAPSPARADSGTPVRRTIERAAPAATHVRVDASTGDVNVVGDDGTTVRVTARIRASSDAAAAKVGVDLTRSGDENVVTVNIPRSSPSFVHWLFNRSRVSVDVLVRVPRRTIVAARLSTGDLDVRGISAAIDVRTATGDVHLHDVAANASATTATGDVAVDLAPRWSGARLTARTATGDVHIRVPPGLRAHVEARTHVGGVHNEIRGTNAASPIIEASSNVGDVTITTR
ncbi:MAG TPA: DUF4097 family beta strand repeat-containing protein [Candidatus Elarobacter sp.]|jgi:hypothetical protein